MLNPRISFKIEDNTYTVSFPSVGQMMEIEAMKFALTNNSYTALKTTGLKSSIYVCDLVDTISFLTVMVPELKKDLKVSSFSELEPAKAKIFLMAYKSTIQPWYLNIFNQLYDDYVLLDESATKA